MNPRETLSNDLNVLDLKQIITDGRSHLSRRVNALAVGTRRPVNRRDDAFLSAPLHQSRRSNCPPRAAFPKFEPSCHRPKTMTNPQPLIEAELGVLPPLKCQKAIDRRRMVFKSEFPEEKSKTMRPEQVHAPDTQIRAASCISLNVPA